ncbi:MAG: hypothetical protein E6K30_06985, partial [Gammaproteobacteria bacterium]
MVGPAASIASRVGRGRRRYGARACGLVLTLTTVAAQAAGTPLDSYLDALKTLRATFQQTVSDAHGNEIDRATGTLIVSRPGKFSW